MNFHWPWFRKSEPSARYVVATRQESMAAQRRRADVMLGLAVYVATTSPDQRRAETENYFTQAIHTRQAAARSVRTSKGGR